MKNYRKLQIVGLSHWLWLINSCNSESLLERNVSVNAIVKSCLCKILGSDIRLQFEEETDDNACGNVHSILGLLSTQSPKRNRWLLSTQSWVLNKLQFWVVIECSISSYFLLYHWVHNIFKFWVSIEYSITQLLK